MKRGKEKSVKGRSHGMPLYKSLERMAINRLEKLQEAEAVRESW